MEELDELRLKIAKAKGYIDHGVMNDGAHEFYLPTGKRTQYFYINGRTLADDELPDWPRDIAAAWPLVEEAASNYLWLELNNIIPNSGDAIVYEAGFSGEGVRAYGTGDTAPEAICRAWLAWKGIE